MAPTPSALERAKMALGMARHRHIDSTESQRYGEWLVKEQRVTLAELTPRVNEAEPPLPTDVELDHARLLSRLDEFGLSERTVEGDGNCQFRAVSDQLYASEGHHHLVRSMCVDQLLCAPERYRDYVLGETFDGYVQKMSMAGEWGDHVTLQALADYLGIEINLICSFESAGLIRVTPQPPAPGQPAPIGGAPLWLSFWAEIHYQSIEMAKAG